MAEIKPLAKGEFIPQAAFDEPDTPKSNTTTLSHRAYVTVGIDYGVGLITPRKQNLSSQFSRLAILADPHLYIDTPIQGLPTDISFAIATSVETKLDGTNQSVSGGGEVRFGLAPIFQLYFRNAAKYNLDHDSLSWQVEGGASLPTLLYEGPILLGATLGFGGYPLVNENNYFTAGLNLSF